MNLFAEIADSWPDAETAEHLGERRLPSPPELDLMELDPERPVVDVYGPVCCTQLLDNWPDTATANSLREALHGLELERASHGSRVTVRMPVAVVTTGSAARGPVPGPQDVSLEPGNPAALPVSQGDTLLDTTSQQRERLQQAVRRQ
jgi:hypothetical protein